MAGQLTYLESMVAKSALCPHRKWQGMMARVVAGRRPSHERPWAVGLGLAVGLGG